MRSVADLLRVEDRAEVLALTPAERVALALALGERDLGLFAAGHQPSLPRDHAAQLLERRRQASRRRSRCLEALIG